MIDVVDKATRSGMMSGIRAKNTRPEIYMRSGLHKLGFRFKLYVKDIPGKPDIVLPKYHSLIIVQGCFWHGHGCRYCKLPQTNSEFWACKIERNQTRDARDQLAQRALGWRTLTVWECAFRASQRKLPLIDVIELAAGWLKSNSQAGVIDEYGLVEC